MTMQTRWNPSRKAAAGILVAMSLCLPAAAFAAEKSFDRTLTVNGPVTLHVSTGSGYIHVSPGSDNQVHIVGHVKGSNSWWGGGSSDEAVAQSRRQSAHQSGGQHHSRGRGPRQTTLGRHVSIDYEITTPATPCLWPRAVPATFSSPISTERSRAHTGSGSIRADKLGAGSRLETGSGTIDATNLMGSTTLQTGSGEVRAQLSSAGDVVAGTGSGSIKLDQRTRGSQGGDRLRQPRDQRPTYFAVEAGDRFGRHHLQVGNAHFTLDAETGSGSVKSDLPLTMRGSMTSTTSPEPSTDHQGGNGLGGYPYSVGANNRGFFCYGDRSGCPISVNVL
jgi:hypothetical protein